MRVSGLNQINNKPVNTHIMSNGTRIHFKENQSNFPEKQFSEKIRINNIYMTAGITGGILSLALLSPKIKGGTTSKVLAAVTSAVSFLIALAAYCQNKKLAKEHQPNKEAQCQ